MIASESTYSQKELREMQEFAKSRPLFNSIRGVVQHKSKEEDTERSEQDV